MILFYVLLWWLSSLPCHEKAEIASHYKIQEALKSLILCKVGLIGFVFSWLALHNTNSLLRFKLLRGLDPAYLPFCSLIYNPWPSNLQVHNLSCFKDPFSTDCTHSSRLSLLPGIHTRNKSVYYIKKWLVLLVILTWCYSVSVSSMGNAHGLSESNGNTYLTVLSVMGDPLTLLKNPDKYLLSKTAG